MFLVFFLSLIFTHFIGTLRRYLSTNASSCLSAKPSLGRKNLLSSRSCCANEEESVPIRSREASACRLTHPPQTLGDVASVISKKDGGASSPHGEDGWVIRREERCRCDSLGAGYGYGYYHYYGYYSFLHFNPFFFPLSFLLLWILGSERPRDEQGERKKFLNDHLRPCMPSRRGKGLIIIWTKEQSFSLSFSLKLSSPRDVFILRENSSKAFQQEHSVSSRFPTFLVSDKKKEGFKMTSRRKKSI